MDEHGLKQLEGLCFWTNLSIAGVPRDVILSALRAHSGGVSVRRNDTGKEFWINGCDVVGFEEVSEPRKASNGTLLLRGPLVIGFEDIAALHGPEKSKN